MAFTRLGLELSLVEGIGMMGYNEPTPIQQQAIPHALAGKDIIGCAQTGTGKTAAFILPTLQLMSDKRGIKALVITPTRELAQQIEEVAQTCARYSGHKVTALYGGVSYGPQETKLRRGIDLLIATPGRLLDMMNRGSVNLSLVEVFVLDEADRMLDMGFWPDVKRVISALPRKRQSLLFSATMSPKVLEVIGDSLYQPVSIEIGPRATPVEAIEQSVYPVDAMQKSDLLIQLLKQKDMPRVLVFSRTKRRADYLCRALQRQHIAAAPIHSDLSQSQRQATLAGFKAGRCRVLVATDIVARGIDVENVSHVINFDIPSNPEDYVHRIGRTARASAKGAAISFLSAEEFGDLRDIEALIGRKLPCEDLEGFEYVSRFIPTSTDVPKLRKKLAYNGGAKRTMQRRARRR